jgi:MFS family permease
MRKYASLLRRRDYRLLWVGATISALGDGMSFVALVWLLFERGADAATVGWLAAAYTGPVVIGGIAAGLILDRFDKRRVLIADNIVRGLAIASVPVAAAAGILTTEHLFVVAAIYGLLFMTSLAGIPSLIPTLVEEEQLTTANAMESLSFSIAGLCGPAAAGAIIALAGATTVLVVDAISYGIFAICLLLMRVPQRDEATDTSPRGDASLRRAARWILSSPAIVAITLLYMAVNVGEGMFIVIAPVYALEVLNGGAATYGALLSSLTAGALIGSLVVGAINWRWPLGRSIALASLATGLAMGGLLLRPSLGPALATLFLAGLFASSLTTWAQTIRMRLIPPEMRGRVFALLRTLMQSTPPIGAVIAGLLLTSGDPFPAIAVMTAFIVVPAAVAIFLPALSSAATGETRSVSRSGDAAAGSSA